MDVSTLDGRIKTIKFQKKFIINQFLFVSITFINFFKDTEESYFLSYFSTD